MSVQSRRAEAAADGGGDVGLEAVGGGTNIPEATATAAFPTGHLGLRQLQWPIGGGLSGFPPVSSGPRGIGLSLKAVAAEMVVAPSDWLGSGGFGWLEQDWSWSWLLRGISFHPTWYGCCGCLEQDSYGGAEQGGMAVEGKISTASFHENTVLRLPGLFMMWKEELATILERRDAS
ncbi:hypothetical protein JRQ81_004711 [Phrynocephalus forsythii]|uniref:Uncharacterized protein n=1 Tax=Phrynocephalus forsythii TaxID=171643 RepID=A0A9Q0Y3E7_9SAUR|nr:hypothetical protein JRQ81_004711 [Phrynocephalus forsythii]